ncbi:MAG: transposase [Planctomycetes bacterium]|nr:transposase [Planctomycetota bacterium]
MTSPRPRRRCPAGNVCEGNARPGGRGSTDRRPGARFHGGHDRVHHSIGEYVRGDVYTNTVEGFFARLKRGIYGTFHHVSKKHLQRYVDDFVFRYNSRKMDDGARVALAFRGANGKRLMYREPVRPNLSSPRG